MCSRKKESEKSREAPIGPAEVDKRTRGTRILSNKVLSWESIDCQDITHYFILHRLYDLDYLLVKEIEYIILKCQCACITNNMKHGKEIGE